MSGARLIGATAALMVVFSGVPASAAGAKEVADATTTVGIFQTMLGKVALLTNRYPKLTDLRAAIASDCRADTPDDGRVTEVTTYCTCAGVVTVAVWMTYPDEVIRGRLAGVMDQGDDDLDELAALSSPQVYASICQAVDGDLARGVAQG